jgi:glycosyltransferase involved in cell wall biosynthesis
MKEKLIIHVDYGSKGNSGFYIDCLIKSFNGGVKTIAFVHHDYIFPNHNASIRKIFGKYSSRLKNKKFSYLIKYIEFFFLFIFIGLKIIYLSRSFEVHLFISIFQNFKIFELLFLIIKKNSKIYIIVHDAVPHHTDFPSFIMSTQEKLYNYADKLIVHTNDSLKKLKWCNKQKIIIPFPLPEFHQTTGHKNEPSAPIRFLFIGHLRLEKGINILLEAWRQIQGQYENIQLTIAGQKSFFIPIDPTKYRNVIFIFEYIGEDEFNKLILESDYVVLPYTNGTNSGVLSVSASLNIPAITSNLPMFTECNYVLKDFIFELENNNLKDKLEYILKLHYDNCKTWQDQLKRKVDNYKNNFNINMTNTLCKLLNQ